MGLALHLIPPAQATASGGRTQPPSHCPGHMSNRSWFIPGVRSERGEEAELLGGQQWLLLQVHPPATTGVWGKLTACLPASTGQRTGPLSWSHPITPEEGEGSGGAQRSANMLALEPICIGRRSPREEESVTVWEGEGQGGKKTQLCAEHPPLLSGGRHHVLGVGPPQPCCGP